jgi:hypothetical protein
LVFRQRFDTASLAALGGLSIADDGLSSVPPSDFSRLAMYQTRLFPQHNAPLRKLRNARVNHAVVVRRIDSRQILHDVHVRSVNNRSSACSGRAEWIVAASRFDDRGSRMISFLLTVALLEVFLSLLRCVH